VPLNFTIGDETRNKTFSVTPDSFLLEDIDLNTGEKMCHIAVVGQRFSTERFDHWRLGECFMENFYVVYNASDPNQPKVGITSEPEPEPEKSVWDHPIIKVVARKIAHYLNYFIDW